MAMKYRPPATNIERLRQTLHRLQRQLKILNGEPWSMQKDAEEVSWDPSEALMLDKDKLAPPRSELEMIEQKILEVKRDIENARKRPGSVVDLFRRCRSAEGYPLGPEASSDYIPFLSKSTSYTASRKLKLCSRSRLSSGQHKKDAAKSPETSESSVDSDEKARRQVSCLLCIRCLMRPNSMQHEDLHHFLRRPESAPPSLLGHQVVKGVTKLSFKPGGAEERIFHVVPQEPSHRSHDMLNPLPASLPHRKFQVDEAGNRERLSMGATYVLRFPLQDHFKYFAEGRHFAEPNRLNSSHEGMSLVSFFALLRNTGGLLPPEEFWLSQDEQVQKKLGGLGTLAVLSHQDQQAERLSKSAAAMAFKLASRRTETSSGDKSTLNIEQFKACPQTCVNILKEKFEAPMWIEKDVDGSERLCVVTPTASMVQEKRGEGCSRHVGWRAYFKGKMTREKEEFLASFMARERRPFMDPWRGMKESIAKLPPKLHLTK
ncbi:hypothetical protein GUITHDRAFT_140923 [Guillardia theta CCMP2712]|uniref:Uncharacterized protein n=1 Tax=Guillardia theta (strain CCMP2712) TaxID=905079 RepID=L1J2L4_GUITC|nr:hypothetical protein GUITHDRAFT_140923 [Guillardia theta CCMP2712]EKX42761.1 hypothetical protein GUITHDRAFT_140923 [Guillardia theta CCMP2712]|eukprot:XP_005829741.1 hypothetical protein GUITHDRAFT_140923 [Guillardia theta CCMP2712]